MRADALSSAQRGLIEAQYDLFRAWYANWAEQPGIVSKTARAA